MQEQLDLALTRINREIKRKESLEILPALDTTELRKVEAQLLVAYYLREVNDTLGDILREMRKS